MTIQRQENTHPYIVARGSSKTQIDEYFIQLEEHKMKVSVAN